MKDAPDLGLTDRLLRPPSSKREHMGAFAYVTYSPKLRRRIYCYTHLGYDLAVHLETDPGVGFYNERPPQLELTPKIHFRASAVSIAAEHPGKRSSPDCPSRKTITVHIVDSHASRQSEDENKCNTGAEHACVSEWVSKWARESGFDVRTWTTEDLRGDRFLLENRKELLGWLSIPTELPSATLFHHVDSAVRNHRVTTIDSVLQACKTDDPDEVLNVLACRILRGDYFADIVKYPLEYGTQVSAFHEFT